LDVMIPCLGSVDSVHELKRRICTTAPHRTLFEDSVLSLWTQLPQHSFSARINTMLAAKHLDLLLLLLLPLSALRWMRMRGWLHLWCLHWLLLLWRLHLWCLLLPLLVRVLP